MIRGAFEADALIFVPSDGGRNWHRASQCVWSTAAKLRGMVSLDADYGELHDFFVTFLGVKPVDLSMAINELKEVGNRQSTSVLEAKESIWTVNSLLSTTPNPPGAGDVLSIPVFPVRSQDGSVTRESAATEFFVVDREPLRQSFEGKVKFLDFTLWEAAKLGPFLEWTNMDKRSLSLCVKEITSFAGGSARPMSKPDRQVRNRAHALLRSVPPAPS